MLYLYTSWHLQTHKSIREMKQWMYDIGLFYKQHSGSHWESRTVFRHELHLLLTFSCLSPMNNTFGDSPVRHIHNNIEISRAFRWGVVQHRGCNVLILLRSLITKSSLVIFVSVFYIYDTTFSTTDIRFFYFCVCRVLDTSSTHPLARSESCKGSSAVLSHRLLHLFTREPAGETQQNGVMVTSICARCFKIFHCSSVVMNSWKREEWTRAGSQMRANQLSPPTLPHHRRGEEEWGILGLNLTRYRILNNSAVVE